LLLSKASSSQALSVPYSGKKYGLMLGLGFSNKLISRNEGLHCDFACFLYSKLTNCLPKKRVIDIVSSAVDIEMEFVVNALPVELMG
jgi:ribonucleotide reductase beta subunit family protein with ferritin-like domain